MSRGGLSFSPAGGAGWRGYGGVLWEGEAEGREEEGMRG